jgi:hypothetical protein
MLAAQMYWLDWLVAPVLKVRYKGSFMLAAPALIDRLMTNYWAGVSGKEKKASINTVQSLYLSIATFPTPPGFSLLTIFMK